MRDKAGREKGGVCGKKRKKNRGRAVIRKEKLRGEKGRTYERGDNREGARRGGERRGQDGSEWT